MGKWRGIPFAGVPGTQNERAFVNHLRIRYMRLAMFQGVEQAKYAKIKTCAVPNWTREPGVLAFRLQ